MFYLPDIRLTAERFGRLWADDLALARPPRPIDALWQIWALYEHTDTCDLPASRCACIHPSYIAAWIAAAAQRMKERINAYLNASYTRARNDAEEHLSQVFDRCFQLLLCVFCKGYLDYDNAALADQEGNLAHIGCLRENQ